MNLQPSRDIQAEMSGVEFYQTKDRLQSGTYQIKEYDGEINYVVVDRYSNVKWYSMREYTDAIHENALNERSADHIRDIMSSGDEEHYLNDESWDTRLIHEESERLADESRAGEPEDLCDTEFNQMVSDVYDTNASDSAAFDDSMSAGASMTATKTIGDLLREYMVKEEQ